MPELEKRPAPIRNSVRVDCAIEDAFRLFTERFGEWWPHAPSAAIEPWVDGRVFDQHGECGRVLAWDPPHRLKFTWHNARQTVEVDFRVEADGTRVTLTHTGWQFSPIQATAFSKFVCREMALLV